MTRFTVDEKGIIRGWNFQGNNCVAFPPKNIQPSQSKNMQIPESIDFEEEWKSRPENRTD
jgi:hypothetical protein